MEGEEWGEGDRRLLGGWEEVGVVQVVQLVRLVEAEAEGRGRFPRPY